MLNQGDLVRFIGCSREQIMWGNNDDPNNILEVGKVYKIETVDVRSQHTKLTLEGIPGRYNSVCFDTD
jgi:hypothetical protein